MHHKSGSGITRYSIPGQTTQSCSAPDRQRQGKASNGTCCFPSHEKLVLSAVDGGAAPAARPGGSERKAGVAGSAVPGEAGAVPAAVTAPARAVPTARPARELGTAILGPGRMLLCRSGRSPRAGGRSGSAVPDPAPGAPRAGSATAGSGERALPAHGTGCGATAPGPPERRCHRPAPTLPPRPGAPVPGPSRSGPRSPRGRCAGPATAGAGTAQPCAG